MAGVFTVRPTYGTNVVCSLGDIAGNSYVVVDADFADQEREQIVYSEEEGGGRVLSARHGTAEARFTIAVLGTSESNVAGKVRTLNQAFGWPHGGTIEFKPIEYPNTVLHTYYHFLKSGPSAKVARKAADLSGGFNYGEIHEFRVRIKGWATSDPESLININNSVGHLNTPDSNNNVITINSSALKGDVTFPFFVISTFGDNGEGFLVYVKSGGSINNGNASAAHGGGTLNVTYSNPGGTVYVGGDFHTTTASTGHINYAVNPATVTVGIDAIPVSASPMIRTLIPSGTTFRFRAKSNFITSDYFEISPWITVIGDGTRRVDIIPSMAYPPVITPDVIANPIAALDSRYLEGLGYELEFSRTVGSGEAEIDMFVMASNSPWIAEFTKTPNGEIMGSSLVLFFDSFTDNHGFYFHGSPADYYLLRDVWTKDGSTIGSLSFDSNQTQYISTMLFRDTAKELVLLDTVNIHIDALWGTIRPFEVS